MPSSFSSLGFPVDMDASYQRKLVTAALTGEQVRSADGTYVRWTPGAGVELWLQVQNREVIGIAPHFVGSSSMRVAITDRIPRPDESPLAGGVRAWANPPGDAPDDGDYPFVFDLPDPDRFSAVSLPCITSVQLAAFAHDFDSFQDETAFDAAQSTEIKFAAESFIPTGTFVSEGQSPGAFAMFTGCVTHVERRVNPFSNGPFWWIKVKTFGGEIDVIADPNLIAAEPRVGSIAKGSSWLSGRLPSELADRSPTFWRRWFPA
jgi:hypothetical protein